MIKGDPLVKELHQNQRNLNMTIPPEAQRRHLNSLTESTKQKLKEIENQNILPFPNFEKNNVEDSHVTNQKYSSDIGQSEYCNNSKEHYFTEAENKASTNIF